MSFLVISVCTTNGHQGVLKALDSNSAEAWRRLHVATWWTDARQHKLFHVKTALETQTSVLAKCEHSHHIQPSVHSQLREVSLVNNFKMV